MTEASEIPFGLEVTKGLVAKFLMAAVGFVGTILFARILGPVAFGGFYLVWSVVKIAKLPVDGFSTASKKRFSETNAERERIAGAMLALIVVLCAVGAIGATVFQTAFESYSGLSNAHFLFAVLFVSVSLFSPFQAMLAGIGRVSQTIWIDFLRSILTTPLQLGFVLLGVGASGMAYGLSLATLLTIPVTHYVLSVRPKLPSWETFRELWTFARHSIVSVTLGRIYNRLDIILLGFLLTPAAAGQYEVALKLTLPAVLVSEVMGEGLMARVSNLRSKGETVGTDVTNSLAFASILSFPLFAGGAVLARPLIVTLYGPDYSAAASLLIGLALFRIFRTQSDPLVQTLNGVGRPDLFVRIAAVTLALNVVLGIALTLRYGAIGVVVATVIAEALKYSATAVAISRLVDDIDILPSTLFEQIAASAIMAAIVFGTKHIVPVRSWFHLAVLVSLGAAVYSIALVGLSERFRHTVQSILSDAGLNEWVTDRRTGR